MAVRKTNAELPEDETRVLQELRARPEQQQSLKERVVALRDEGWPLRAIGEAVNVSRMMVHVWEKEIRQNPDALARVEAIDNVPALPLTARGSGTSVRKMQPDVPVKDRERLAELAAQAKTVRRWTPENAPEREASKELDKLVHLYVEKRRVTPMKVARYAGVTRRAIMARLERMHEREAISA